MMCRISLVALLALAGLGWSELARATPEYPVAIDGVLQTRCGEPRARCLICHTNARGGEGTAEQAFALQLRDYGLNRGNDSGALRAALNRLNDNDDSDGDGDSDREELSDCRNPSGAELGAPPEYGCDGAQLVPVAGHPPGLALLAGGVALLLVRLGRRRRR